MLNSDSVLRAITDDGAFRVIAARTTETVQGILDSQRAPRYAAQVFSDLITGVILIRETMSPDQRVQGILKPKGERASLLADSNGGGDTRGLVSLGSGRTDFDLPGAILQMMRTMINGQLHQGMVEVPEGGDVSQALMTYMQASEQINTMIAVGSLFDGDRLVRSGGYLVQLLPEVERSSLAIMAQRLEDYRTMDQLLQSPDFAPRPLLEDLLYLMPFTQLGNSPVRYHCWCSRTRLITALSTLPRAEIDSMVHDGQVLQISCDYCHHDYAVSPSELQGLLGAS
ncbi:MAG TPA: Hsp33 family molecular chaperone HslO [Polyangiaceae bacterium]|nr:Hsp33 family molecular chaperone HslO [Polyangiaceae bacterium]